MIDDLSICDGLIEYHKNNKDYKIRGLTAAGQGKGKVSTDVTIMPAIQNKVAFNYMLQLMQVGVDGYCKKYSLDTMFKIGLKEGWNIQHYAPNEGFFTWHCERSAHQTNQRALVFMTYLNDVEDGGETEFFYQKVKVKPKKGLTLLWPTDFTHMHRGITSPTEHKYIATGWVNFFDVIDTQSHYMELEKTVNEMMGDKLKDNVSPTLRDNTKIKTSIPL